MSIPAFRPLTRGPGLAGPYGANDSGGDHGRSPSVFLNGVHPKRTEGEDVRAGTTVDQIAATHIGQDTPLPSLQLCIESIDGSGACDYGYSCVYSDTISWSSPTSPLPMTRDPRQAFESLFGDGGTAEQRAARLKDMGLAVRSLVPGFNSYTGAGVLAGTSNLYHLRTTAGSQPVITGSYPGPLYSADMRAAATRPYAVRPSTR